MNLFIIERAPKPQHGNPTSSSALMDIQFLNGTHTQFYARKVRDPLPRTILKGQANAKADCLYEVGG